MRKGKNPAKLDNNNKIENIAFHQIIVPIHLPELNGYYKEGLDILKLCIESIYLTVHDKTFISVVNNGSCQEVRHYLDNCLNEKKIHEVIHTSAIGKINAIAKGLVGHNFDLVTITDADVLFINGWQKAVYDIYETFPKAGMVGTTPQPSLYRSYNEMMILENIFNPNFKFFNINPQLNDDILNFMKSIGHNQSQNKTHIKKIIAIENKKVKAISGTGHYTATYKKELLFNFRKKTSNLKAGGIVMRDFVDNPSVQNGHWRLCTFKNYTYHMGNVKETWMVKKINSTIQAESKSFILKKPKIKSYKSLLPVNLIRGLVRKVFYETFLFKYFLIKKGLTQKDAKNY